MPDPSPTPQYESGGGKLIFGAAILVVAALSGIGWSLMSRQSAPPDAPSVQSRFLPPSERKDVPTAVTPAPTLEKSVPAKSPTAPSPSNSPNPIPSY